MKKTFFIMLLGALVINQSLITAQVQTGVFKTPSGNTDYHHFTRNNSSASGAAVFINQEAATGSILRLSSGTATFNQNVKFSFESNGNFGIGTATPAEKLSLFTAGDTKVVTQYGNGTGSGFTVGMSADGNGSVWHTAAKLISFGTSNKEKMRINSGTTIDFFSTIQSPTGGYKIDTTGIFQSKGYRTVADNVNYHHFTANHASNAAVFINQTSAAGPILRLSSGIATANQNVKFSFENNGNLGIGTITNISDKLVLYSADTTNVYTQYGNTKSPIGANKSFVVGVTSAGAGMMMHRGALSISLGTSNKEKMRINSGTTIDFFSTIQSVSGGYKIDTTGVFQSKGYRTVADNANYHHFTANHASNAAVFINQTSATAPILRLSSGIATANQNVKFSFENSGNLGIGTSSPAEKLSLYTAGNTKVVTQYGNGTGSGFVVGINTDGNGMIWHSTASKALTFGAANAERMRINANGNIGIGTVSPDRKLDVVGAIRAHSVEISTTKTADFVFEEDYPLMPLPEVERFITANKHLPEIAPATEMLENGLNMGDMQIKLLQKIEELTLYVIQQQKEIDEMKKELKVKN